MIKEEKSRMTKLVAMAYENDPRVQFEEEKLRVEKEKMKEERLIQKIKEKEEEEQRIKFLKKQYEENLKKQQENTIKERELMINTLISSAETIGVKLSKDDIFQIQLNGKTVTIKTILNELDSKDDVDSKIRIFKNMTGSTFGLKFAEDANAKHTKEENIWKKEEINNLQKGVKKFPAGVKNRWEKIGELVTTKSTNQIINMTHFLTTNPSIKIDSDVDLNQLLNKLNNKNGNPEKIIAKSETSPIVQTKNSGTNVVANNGTTDEDAWSEEQQKNLESALKKISIFFTCKRKMDKHFKGS